MISPSTLTRIMDKHQFKLKLFLFFLLLSSTTNVSLAKGNEKLGHTINPFTAKAAVIRYWNRQISNDLPKPFFLLSKASPLSAADSAFFTQLAQQNNLSTHLPSFCSSANLVCFPDPKPSLEKHTKDVNFASYSLRNFTNYGSGQLGSENSFKNYSIDENVAADSFRRYSPDSVRNKDKFNIYQPDGNQGDSDFKTYGKNTTTASSEFKNYDRDKNGPHLRFTSYGSDSRARKNEFLTYSNNTNSGHQSFTSYNKNSKVGDDTFVSYSNSTNVVGSSFSSYAESGKSVNDSFTSYAFKSNVVQNTFDNYANNGNGATESFNSYRDQANVGDDTFQSYAEKSNSTDLKFTSYGKPMILGPTDFVYGRDGTDSFVGYGKSGTGSPSVGFKEYGNNTIFKEYQNKRAVSFSQYKNPTADAHSIGLTHNEKVVNRWVEPGKFFSEAMLKEGNVMPMPDIKDKMPIRSFLPRIISSKLPFSSSHISVLKQIFHATENSSMDIILKDTIQECERAPSMGETKKCVSSMEDMIDFAVSMLGHNVVVRSIESVKGSKQDVLIGKVKGINGGKVTKSVSCHQSLFPYLVYYCHSVPKVRVYEADILDAKTREKINHGTAICHLDTSAWSPSHGAFVALGSSPGKTEVCHWIFENDMTWATAD